MAQDRIRISPDWGNVAAELADNAAARSLIQMLPVTIDMRDHLRQEKTGNLPSPLPEIPRQREFSKGTLGLWGPDHFVIYHSSGRVPQPGFVILGKVTGTSRSSTGPARLPCASSAQPVSRTVSGADRRRAWAPHCSRQRRC